MCGIFGYVGTPVSVDQVVMGALRAMEYRGYDSWGTAFVSCDNGGEIAKGVGRVPQSSVLHREASAAIGHTRWATHGNVSERNAHPHLSRDGRIAVVHNGIIENADALRRKVAGSVSYVSDTDTEVMAHLVQNDILRGVPLHRAVENAFLSMEGANAFVVLDLLTQEVVAITRQMPIRISRTEDSVSLASDPSVFAGQAETLLVLPDDVPVSLGRPGVMAESLIEIERTGERVGVPVLQRATHTGPGSSMCAEISEQPAVMERIAATRSALDEVIESVARAPRVVFTGCGSAFHAAMFGADRFSYGLSGIEALAIPASEMSDRGQMLGKGDVVVALTQSGETADVIDAVAFAAEQRATTVGMVNVAGSSVARMVDVEVPLLAGTERSVLATKSFIAMLGRMTQLVDGAMQVAGTRAGLGACPESLVQQADEMASMLATNRGKDWIDALQTSLSGASSALVVGAGAHRSIAAEAALKIKEGTYVHAEAVSAGELKHGVIALVQDGFPCLLMSGNRREAARMGIVAAELASRGASVFSISAEIRGQPCAGIIKGSLVAGAPFTQSMMGQMVALETALARGVDPDYPRNLAKCVTVR